MASVTDFGSFYTRLSTIRENITSRLAIVEARIATDGPRLERLKAQLTRIDRAEKELVEADRELQDGYA